MSAVSMPTICETYARQPALHHLEQGPGRRARRRHRQSLLHHRHRAPCCAPPSCAATPCSRRPRSTASIPPTRRRDPTATRYDRLTHDEAIARDLQGHGHRRLRACPREPAADHRRLASMRRARSTAILTGSAPLDHRRPLTQRAGSDAARGKPPRNPTACLRTSRDRPCDDGRDDLRPRRPQAPHAGRGQLPSSTTSAACAPAAPRRTCSIRSRSTPTARRCRSTRSRPSACRSRACSASRSGTAAWCSAVEKAIRDSDLGLNPQTEGQVSASASRR